jgi:Zn-dependent peptidase ImmA (M78 family)
MAARLVKRLALEPRVDVDKIAKSLATVREKSFPIEIDGLCLDIKVPGLRPKIWLSNRLGPVRRRFTLAHEIGHIIIPWHAGSIVDDLEAPRTGARGKYREMEAEANRFAAELLMPTEWVVRTAERAEHASALMHTIVHVADVSYPAAMIRVQKLGPSGYVGAEVKDGLVVWSGRTRGTRMRPPEVGTFFDEIEMPAALEPESLFNGVSQYVWWKIRDEVEAPPPPVAPWREILDAILLAIPAEHREKTRNRANAVVGYAIGKLPKGAKVEHIYQRALENCENRSDRDLWLATVIAHPDFSQYLLARAHERAASR